MGRRERVECDYLTAKQYERMVAATAWEVWRKLPSHTRGWVSVEDMVEDGMRFVTLDTIPKWNPERGMLSTIIRTAVHRFFENTYLRYFFYGKRNEIGVHSLDGLKERVPGVEDWVVGSRDERKEILQRLFVVAAVMEVYEDGSPGLKEQIRRWFFSGKRLHKKTREFRKAGKEFRQKAGKIGLGFEDCQFLMNSPDCMTELQKGIGVVVQNL